MKVLWNVHIKPGRGPFLFFAFLLLFLHSCDKDEEERIPDVAVNISININKPSYSELRATGGWVYLTGGSKGIIVYRFSSDEFMAYDRHCTYKPEENCGRARVDSSDIKIHCRDCHGSEYSIADGSVLKGPASRPLRRYSTSFDGSIVRIYN